MNYLRSALTDARLKYRVNRLVSAAANSGSTSGYPECVALADHHPTTVLTALRDNTTYSHPEASYRALLLLEHLVASCNYGFHEALANHHPMQDKILQLAVRRVEDEPNRRLQRYCRLILLEYSRMFADDKALEWLSTLAVQFERRTRKSLLRCINIQTRHIAFREVRQQDVVVLSPRDGTRRASDSGGSVGVGVKDLAPLRYSKAEVWLCSACGYMNAPAAMRCGACETAMVASSASPAAGGGGGGSDGVPATAVAHKHHPHGKSGSGGGGTRSHEGASCAHLLQHHHKGSPSPSPSLRSTPSPAPVLVAAAAAADDDAARAVEEEEDLSEEGLPVTATAPPSPPSPPSPPVEPTALDDENYANVSVLPEATPAKAKAQSPESIFPLPDAGTPQ